MIKSRLPQFFVVAATATVFTFVAQAVTVPGSSQEADLELGAEIYETQCEACHGAEGKGDGPAARFLDATPRDLTAGDWMYVDEVTTEQVAQIVSDGIADTEMEPFGELLLEEEIMAVSAYVIAEFRGES